MAWLDQRTTSGSWRVARDFPNLPAWTVKAVGGTTTHWAGACPRFKDYEFTTSHYGKIDGANLLDWPITLADLAPFYDEAEKRMGVTHVHGRPPLPANNNYKVFANGAERVGYTGYSTGPYATNAEPYDGRPASIQDGFNFQGDKHGSKWSTLVAELPKAAKTGNLDLRSGCHVAQITHDASGKVDGVLYFEDGALHKQSARAVCVAGNAIETARLLLLSARRSSPTAWPTARGRSAATTCAPDRRRRTPASSSRCTCTAARRWPGSSPTRPGSTPRAASSAATTWRPSRWAGLPRRLRRPGAWGPAFTEILDGYENTAGMWIVGEDMPQSTNAVTLNGSVTDQHGLPVPNVHFDDHANDVAMREYAWEKGAAIYEAVGATATHRTPPYPSTHNMGTARMSERPQDGVVDANGRAHDIPNLYVSDGSVFTTGAAANPTLTIVALAIRQGRHIAEQIRSGAMAKEPAAA
jgi:choline dehydrogenase-like flavoprotein